MIIVVVIDANEWFFPHFQVRKTKIGTRTRKMGITCQKSSLLCCHIPRFEICAPKPSLKIESVNKAFLFWYWQWPKKYFFRNKTFLFFKIESWNFQHLSEKKIVKPHKISTNSNKFYFHFFYPLSDWVAIVRFHEILF